MAPPVGGFFSLIQQSRGLVGAAAEGLARR